MNITSFFSDFHPTVKRLLLARALRSTAQGIAFVDLTLYLKDMDWSGTQIGAVLTMAGLVGAFFILLVGMVSDRYGRKKFLYYYELLTALAALLTVVTSNSVVLSLVIILAGFGRGQNGAAGPFTPAEQAWLAAYAPLSERGRIFSVNNAVGNFGTALGSVIGGATVFWDELLPGAFAYRPLFLLMCLLSVACAWVIFGAPPETGTLEIETGKASDPVLKPDRDAAVSDSEDVRKANSTAPDPAGKQSEKALRRAENWNLVKLSAVNVINGLAVGMMSPMMAYWFAVKYNATTAEIGITIALSSICTGFSSLAVGWLAQRFGMVKSVVWLRVSGTLLIALLPLMPVYWLASVVYVLRSALSRGTAGARAALSTSLTRDSRRGFSASINSLSVRATSAVGPSLSGYMMSLNQLSLPFYLSAGLQIVSAYMYSAFFRRFDRADPESEAPRPAAGGPQTINR
jgi:MFS family permease